MHGPVATLQKVTRKLYEWCTDSWYEKRMGLKTSRIVLNSELDADTRLLAHGKYYAAASYSVLFRLLRRIDRDRYGSTFVDYGCGRGRALAVAVHLGFKQVIGVEYSNFLCESARENLSRLEVSDKTIVEVLHMDAGEFEVPDQAQVFYFFNPFDTVIMDRVIANILESVREVPRDVCAVYVNSVCLASFLNAGFDIAFAETTGGEPSHILTLKADNGECSG